MMSKNIKLPGSVRIDERVVKGLLHRSLHIDAQESKFCAKLWATREFTKLFLGSRENPDLKNIECLNDFVGVTKLHIMLLDYAVDLAPLIRHADTLIDYFCNDEINSIIDCDRYLALQSLNQTWDSRMKFANNHPQLIKLCFDKYCPKKEKDLDSLPMAPNLKDLDLLRSCIKTLSGIEKYPNLEKLVITLGKYLTTIGDLTHCPFLKVLELEGCKNIDDLQETLSKCHRLERLVLMKVSDLENIRFIEHLPNLKWLNLMDTNVIDGDMSPLLNHPSLEYVVFTSKKHFSHTEAQIRALLQARKSQ